MTQNVAFNTGAQSSDFGYSFGGNAPSFPGYTNVIDKFPFASDGTATDVGDIISGTEYSASGQSSTTHGYSAGGYTPYSNVIQKFSFTTDGNATDVGDLTETPYQPAGHQV